MNGVLHMLENGVRVYLDPMPSLETVALGVWARAGAVDERAEEHGVAHLLEHMAFKGTENRSARDIAEDIEAVGGYLNAATSHQRTGYYARVLKDDIALGLDILSDILLNPVFDAGELAKEKEVVVQEIGEAADTPDDVVFDLLQAASWDGHPLARTILGTRESVRAQSPASLKGFMARGYRPEAMIVAASGKLEAAPFLELAARYFGGINGGAGAVARSAPAFKGGLRHDARAIEQTHLALSFPGVSARDDDFFATRVFADLLGGGMSSRLFQTIREERGLAYSVYAFADGYEHCGLAGAYVAADAEQIAEAARLVRQQMEDVAKNPTEREIDRARAMLRASIMMSLESPAARIENAVGQLFTLERTLSPDEISERLDAVAIDDVKRCAARALSGPVSAAMVGPGDIMPVDKALQG